MMEAYSDASNDHELLNENSLPVELQSKNIVNPAFIISTPTVINGKINNAVNNQMIRANNEEARVVITEQPQQRGFRYRYECEGPSHGGLQGMKSERGKKSYPAIKIENYTGAARIVVSLVTDEKNPRSHAHKLVGTICKDGRATVEITANAEPISFPNLCILHVTRKRLVDVLTERIIDTIKLDKKLKANNMNFEPPITDEDRQSAKLQAQEQSKTMQLNVVRLCFQVFLRNPDGSFSKMLTPVVSQPIYDSKSPGASALKICRMDKYGGCCSGNDEVFLLCEKVQKDDIQVRFVELNADGSVKWEEYGNFGPLDVHRQYAIVFKTPPYWNTNIDKAVNVLIMLQRKSDQEVSEPKAFTYFPQNRDKDNIARKKRKRIPLDGYDFGGDGGGFGGAGGGFGGDSVMRDDNDFTDDGGRGGSNGRNMPNSRLFVSQNPEYQITPNQKTPERSHDHNNPSQLNGDPFVAQDRRMVSESKAVYSATDKESDFKFDEDGYAHSLDDMKSNAHIDIEVDGALSPPPVKYEQIWDKDQPSPSSSSLSPSHSKHRPGDRKPSSSDTDSHKDSSGDKIDSPYSSRDWMDSGVETISSKTFLSLDEKKEKSGESSVTEIEISSATPALNLKNENRLEVSEVKTSKPSSVSDYQSESDGRIDIVSEGMKSDEGFSETSEEQAQKLKAKSLTTQLISTTHHKHPLSTSEMTFSAKQVTELVAERTLAALTDYAETGDIRHLLLVQRHLMAISNINGDLPLHLAVINSQPDAVKNLLDVMSTLSQTKKHINSTNLLRQTPLHLATILQMCSVVEMLLHAGADPTVADRNGNTPAHLAMIDEASDCLTSLVKYVRPGMSKINPFPELNYLNYDGYSPVHLAAKAGKVSMLRTLVFGKADLDLLDGKSGKTALHHAVDNDDLPIVTYLLTEAECDVNARCFDGNTALHIACARQLVSMTALLVSSGANTECENEEIPVQDSDSEESGKCDRRGHTPKDYADGNEKILSILNKDFSDISSQSESEDFFIQKLSSMTIEPSIISDSIMSYSDSGIESIFSQKGLQSLSTKTRIELSRLLDPVRQDHDVTALAEKLGYSKLWSSLEEMRDTGNSPTTFLLEFFESDRGSLQALKDSLFAIDRNDVADLL